MRLPAEIDLPIPGIPICINDCSLIAVTSASLFLQIGFCTFLSIWRINRAVAGWFRVCATGCRCVPTDGGFAPVAWLSCPRSRNGALLWSRLALAFLLPNMPRNPFRFGFAFVPAHFLYDYGYLTSDSLLMVCCFGNSGTDLMHLSFLIFWRRWRTLSMRSVG